MSVDVLDRVKTRVRSGMCPESAMGLEWRLMRAREGFDGNTWAASVVANEITPATIKARIAILRYMSGGTRSSDDIVRNVRAPNIANNLKNMCNNGMLHVVRKVSGNFKIYEITQKGYDWLVENDRQSSLF